jgi:uncharacterized protein YidB (DUF937 family)
LDLRKSAPRSLQPKQIQMVLGNQQVQAFAAKAGIPMDKANAVLAQVLPQVVDHVTPNGQVPQQSDLVS